MAKSNPFKYAIKRGAHHIAARFGGHTRPSKEPQLLVLMYHRILPYHDKRTHLEEPGMIVTPTTFKQNLEIASNYFQFIELSEWLERKSNGLPLPPKACAITFDDGWADNYEYAYPILQELNIPATIFLVSNMIGTNKLFWPERLAHIVNEIATNTPSYWSNPNISWLTEEQASYKFNKTPPTQEELSQLIANTKRFSDHEAHALIDTVQLELELDGGQFNPSLLNWEQVSEMLNSGLIEVGSHTCHHTRLNSKTSKQSLVKEAVASKEQIEKNTEHPVKSFCFPNGDYTAEALSIVRTHYLGAVTTKSGWNSLSSDNHLIQRIGIHEDIAKDKTAFLARISGWF